MFVNGIPLKHSGLVESRRNAASAAEAGLTSKPAQR
jgi:hypothetical protein